MKYILKLNVSAVRIPLLNLPTFWGDRPTGGKGLALPGSSGPNLPWEVWNFHGPRCEVSWEKNTSPKLIWYPWSLTLQLANRERVGIFQPPLFFFFSGAELSNLGGIFPQKRHQREKREVDDFFLDEMHDIIWDEMSDRKNMRNWNWKKTTQIQIRNQHA